VTEVTVAAHRALGAGVRRRWRRVVGREAGPVAAATAVAAVIMVSGFLVGFLSTHRMGSDFGPAPSSRDDAAAALALSILARNLGIVLLLFSGVVTAGVSTVMGFGLVSIYIGATFGAAAANVGAAAALGSIVTYAPVEFAAFLIAAAAGLLPIASVGSGALPGGDRGPGGLQAYLRPLPVALRLLGTAAALLILAALLETATIIVR